MKGDNLMRPDADSKTEGGSEFLEASLKHVDVEGISGNIALYIAVRRHLLAPCPNNWMHTDDASGFGDTAAEAEADAATFADVVGALLAVQYEKTFQCGKFSCEANGAECVFDWGLIGTPTKAVQLPAATTKKHQIAVKGKWESKQKMGFGCFCFRDA